MWNPNIKVINITKLVQMIFNSLIWMFWVYQLSPAWYNVDCSQCFDLTAINNWSTRLWHIIQREIFNTKSHKPPLTHSVTHRTFFHTLHKPFFFFLRFSYVFTFLEIIKLNMAKMLLFCPSSTLKWLHKFK